MSAATITTRDFDLYDLDSKIVETPSEPTRVVAVGGHLVHVLLPENVTRCGKTPKNNMEFVREELNLRDCPKCKRCANKPAPIAAPVKVETTPLQQLITLTEAEVYVSNYRIADARTRIESAARAIAGRASAIADAAAAGEPAGIDPTWLLTYQQRLIEAHADLKNESLKYADQTALLERLYAVANSTSTKDAN